MRRVGETRCDIASFISFTKKHRVARVKVHVEAFPGSAETPSSDQREKRTHLGFPYDTEHEVLTQVSPELNAASRPRIVACYLK